MDYDRLISVEVAYALPERQQLIRLRLPADSTVGQAIRRSGILQQFPEIKLGTAPVGVFGRRCMLEESLRDGDRIEIYRPLTADPKEVRRRRARAKAERHRSSG